MIQFEQQNQSDIDHALKEWIKAYVDLKWDVELHQFVVDMSREEAGKLVLDQSRRMWRVQGLWAAPFDFIFENGPNQSGLL